jgi:hypothetical protein
MRISQSFEAIEAGEVDDFAFNISRRVGQDQIVATEFICRMTPFSEGADPNPPSRVTNPTFSNTGLYYRDQNGALSQTSGHFAIARVGAMPASAAGGTYILGYKVYLSSGRIIQGSATVQCTLQGGQ